MSGLLAVKASDAPRRAGSWAPGQAANLTNKCLNCSKTVYEMEKVVADGMLFHKGCFRCEKCNGVLSLGKYASMDNRVFCKVCFKKNFFTKGNYSEGFGKLTPQKQFELGLPPTATVEAAVASGVVEVPVAADAAPSTSTEVTSVENDDAAARAAAEKVASEEKAAMEKAASEEKAAAEQAAAKKADAEADAEKEASEVAKAAVAETSSSDPSTPQPATTTTSDATPAVVTAASDAPASPKPSLVAAAFSKFKDAEPAAASDSSSPATPASPAVARLAGGGRERSSSWGPGKVQQMANTCQVCSKRVYEMEKLAADGLIFHKTCFRCKKCNCVLSLGKYASMDNQIFCKVCFKKNFFTKGNYSEGFGKLTPQQQHERGLAPDAYLEE